ncbi:MAG: hypothetical protein ACRD88_12610 [Terriglobia bacterium]
MLKFLFVFFRSRASLIAENLFLRKQLALFQERKQKPRTASLRLWARAARVLHPVHLTDAEADRKDFLRILGRAGGVLKRMHGISVSIL